MKTVEPIELDDESLVDLPEVSDTTPVGGGTGVIGSVIGAYPSRFAPCSKEGAQYAAQKLHDAAICVGPCNCAWSSSYFLNYIGCTNLKHGNTTKLEKLLEGIGWVRRPITKENRKNLPVGLLVGKGHVGVSLGNGLQFQSGGLKEDWKEMNQRGKGNCPAIGRDSYANPAPCNFCTKISGIRPIVSPEHKDGWNARCSSNQVWDKDTIWNTFWYDIISPPGS
ncbi:MAG: hypothetical protein A2563_03650 [Candidatus Magasanikbacteria bacterium RIFOXYD1_FULL_40_23]|uniref:Uncharacterized protein n=1 Tax=Candidatus Magasanikbacteria bacterium RIFOXYD1_FULL_40_23 TaxID=1798705 RepID=A0A1F6P983_9BACT|nr:MAG: hypothetical protein A2563_03650 [Candidatus Magasanikbacteria bacterium RIFOXYD1_FULL_40_23]